MNAIGILELGVALAAVAGALVGFNALVGKGPRGTVWLLAASVFTWASMLPVAFRDPDGLPLSRELSLLISVVRLCALIGGFIGIVDLLQKRLFDERHPLAASIIKQPLTWGVILVV